VIAVLCALVTVLVALAAVVVWRDTQPGLLASLEKRRTIVTLKSGEAFEGLLISIDSDCLVLREASALSYGQGSQNVIVQGEAVLLRSEVAYLQFP
jgi:small nuclear ribonucleoprotein (snRNP)-like protein